MLSSSQHMGLWSIRWNISDISIGLSLWDIQIEPAGANQTMVSIDLITHKILTYIPYVLVLIDLRYEGKKLTI